MKCMKQHRAELSPECRAKIAEQCAIDGTRPASGGSSSREKCAAMAADQNRLGGVSGHRFGGPAALKRCMQGQPM